MQLRLTPEHPDVIRLKRRINGLKQRAEAESLDGAAFAGVDRTHDAGPGAAAEP